jgi:hypothetical protein
MQERFESLCEATDAFSDAHLTFSDAHLNG